MSSNSTSDHEVLEQRLCSPLPTPIEVYHNFAIGNSHPSPTLSHSPASNESTTPSPTASNESSPSDSTFSFHSSAQTTSVSSVGTSPSAGHSQEAPRKTPLRIQSIDSKEQLSTSSSHPLDEVESLRDPSNSAGLNSRTLPEADISRSLPILKSSHQKTQATSCQGESSRHAIPQNSTVSSSSSPPLAENPNEQATRYICRFCTKTYRRTCDLK